MEAFGVAPGSDQVDDLDVVGVPKQEIPVHLLFSQNSPLQADRRVWTDHLVVDVVGPQSDAFNVRGLRHLYVRRGGRRCWY